MEEQLKILMSQFGAVNAAIRKLEMDKAQLRTEILTLIKINDIVNYETEDYSLNFKMQRKKNFDKEKAIAFLTNNGERPEDYFAESEYEMLIIKRKTEMKEQ